MSEGELKKRIRAEINADWADKLFRNADYVKGELATQEQTLTEILDEAKAELFNCLSSKHVSEKYPDAYDILDEDQLISLLLKWFGSTNVKEETTT